MDELIIVLRRRRALVCTQPVPGARAAWSSRPPRRFQLNCCGLRSICVGRVCAVERRGGARGSHTSLADEGLKSLLHQAS